MTYLTVICREEHHFQFLFTYLFGYLFIYLVSDVVLIHRPSVLIVNTWMCPKIGFSHYQ